MMLTGSEKQVKWANDIISSALEMCDANIKLAEERIEKWPNVSVYKQNLDVFTEIKATLEDAFSKATTAKEIIDKREYYSGDRILYVADKMLNGR